MYSLLQTLPSRSRVGLGKQRSETATFSWAPSLLCFRVYLTLLVVSESTTLPFSSSEFTLLSSLPSRLCLLTRLIDWITNIEGRHEPLGFTLIPIFNFQFFDRIHVLIFGGQIWDQHTIAKFDRWLPRVSRVPLTISERLKVCRAFKFGSQWHFFTLHFTWRANRAPGKIFPKSIKLVLMSGSLKPTMRECRNSFGN